MRQRGGFTLIETLMAVVVIGLLCLIGFPRLTNAMMKNNVRSARTVVLTMYARARSAAIETGRTATLHFNGGTAVVTAAPRLSGAGTCDTIMPPVNLTTQYGVTVASSGASDLVVDGRGFSTNGAGATTISLTHGSVKDSMVISGFGMVVK